MAANRFQIGNSNYSLPKGGEKKVARAGIQESNIHQYEQEGRIWTN